jgi:branched-chain amino acid transport system substrate-binding protein
MKVNRRSFLKLALAGGVASQGLNLLTVKDLFAKKTSGDPIIIGHQCDFTGGISSWGYWHDKAIKTAIEHLNANNGIAGRPVKYVMEDTETNPPTAARKFRSLVQRNKADFVIGSVHSGCDLATVPIAKELKTVYIPQGMAAEMTGAKGNRYTFRVGSDTYAQAAAGAAWAMKNLGKTWTFFFADYGWGWSHYNEHKLVLDKLGAEVTPPIAVPLDAKDMLPYLVKVPDKTEQLYSIFFGAQSVAFFEQSKSLGLSDRMKRYTVICTHESISPKDIGGATEDIYLLEFLPRMLKYKDTPYNRKVRELMKVDPVDGMEEGSSRIIDGSHYWACWESVFFIKDAVEKSGWKSKKDTPDFIQALEGMEVKESFQYPQGDKYMRREDHKAVIDHYMSHVENGEIHVKMKLPKEDIVKRFPPRYDFTKESF